MVSRGRSCVAKHDRPVRRTCTIAASVMRRYSTLIERSGWPGRAGWNSAAWKSAACSRSSLCVHSRKRGNIASKWKASIGRSSENEPARSLSAAHCSSVSISTRASWSGSIGPTLSSCAAAQCAYLIRRRAPLSRRRATRFRSATLRMPLSKIVRSTCSAARTVSPPAPWPDQSLSWLYVSKRCSRGQVSSSTAGSRLANSAAGKGMGGTCVNGRLG